MSDKLPAFTVEQRDQVIKLSKVGAFEIDFENEEIVVYAMCEPNDAEKKSSLIEGAQQRILEEVVRVNFLELIKNAANELVYNAEDRVGLFAISGHLKELPSRQLRADRTVRRLINRGSIPKKSQTGEKISDEEITDGEEQ